MNAKSADCLRVHPLEITLGALAGALTGFVLALPFVAGRQLSVPPADWRQWLALILLVAGALAGLYFAGAQASVEHVRGVRYYPDLRRGKRVLQSRERELMSNAQRTGIVRGWEIANIEIARKREVGHIELGGVPGSGKSTITKSACDQSIERGDRTLIFDPKGDYVARYFGRVPAILAGPWDLRGSIWFAARDLRHDVLITELSRIIIGDGPATKENQFFYRTAQRLLAGLIRSFVGEWSWCDLYGALGLPPTELVRTAARGDAQIHTLMPSFSGLGGDVTGAEKNVLSTLAERTALIRQLAAVDKPDCAKFSVRDWLFNPDSPRLLILNANAQFESAVQELFGALLAVVADIIASPEMPEKNADQSGVSLILDEYPQAGPDSIRHLQRIEEVGRSRGVRVLKAMQDPAQLRALLGRERAAAVTAIQSTRIYCRPAPEAAADICRLAGDREILRYSSDVGADSPAGKRVQPERRAVLLPSDLLGLREVADGVEMLVQIEDVIARVVQPFASALADRDAPASVDSPDWLSGPQKPERAPAVVNPSAESSAAHLEILP